MRRRLIGAAVLACCVAAAWPATAGACGEFRHSHARSRPARNGRPPLLIGDSTAIFATPILGRLGIEADAHGCRFFGQGVQMLRARRRDHSLPHVVALALGANGPVSRGQISAALRVMGRDRVLALVTARRSPGSDAAMRAAAHRHPDRVLLIDWVGFSAGHGSWFAGDGLHIGQAGASAYAHLIRRRIAPFAFPPVRRLRVGPPASAGKRCGCVLRRGRTLGVLLPRGGERVTCARARAIVRTPPTRSIRGWRTYDWRAARPRTWSWVSARADRSVLVGAAPLAAHAGNGRS